jgi:hypothetical protein
LKPWYYLFAEEGLVKKEKHTIVEDPAKSPPGHFPSLPKAVGLT